LAKIAYSKEFKVLIVLTIRLRHFIGKMCLSFLLIICTVKNLLIKSKVVLKYMPKQVVVLEKIPDKGEKIIYKVYDAINKCPLRIR